jgi:hypothetical protein
MPPSLLSARPRAARPGREAARPRRGPAQQNLARPSGAKEPGWPLHGRTEPQRVWSLWQSDSLMHAEIREHPLGHEVRVYLRGDFICSYAHPMLEKAEQEAYTLKREWLAQGWTNRPVKPR